MAHQQPSVLLVEDEPAQREVLAYNLEADGFHVTSAENGEEALLLVDETAPDIILLDWMLPNVSGIEVCRQLKSRNATKGVPIIMISARCEEVDRVRGLETGERSSIHLGKDNRLRQQTAFRFPRELVAGQASAQNADDRQRHQSNADQRNHQRERRPPFLLDVQHWQTPSLTPTPCTVWIRSGYPNARAFWRILRIWLSTVRPDK